MTVPAKRKPPTPPKRTNGGHAQVIQMKGKRKPSTTRAATLAIDHYLQAIRKQMGPKADPVKLQARITAAEKELKDAGPNLSMVARVQKLQHLRDMQERLDHNTDLHIPELEAEFVRVMPEWSAKRRITYGTWREMGVSPEVLKKCGIVKTIR